MPTNYHQHSAYSDGQGTLDDYVRAALAAGLTSMGFSDHAPVPFPTAWTMPLDSLAAYHAQVQTLKVAYQGQIELYAGLEMDYFPGRQDFQRQKVLSWPWDYVIGAIHYLGHEPDGQPWSIDESRQTFERGLYGWFQGDIRCLADLYFATVREMVQAGGITIVGHLDYIKRYNDHGRYFGEASTWYRQMVEETLQVIAARDLIVEVNSGGWRCPCGSAFPSPWILRRCCVLGIRVTVNSDAHQPSHLTHGLARGLKRVQEAGYTEAMRLVGGRWVGWIK